MATWNQKGYDSYSGCDIVVTARLATLNNSTKKIEEKIYTLGSIQTLSVSTHQEYAQWQNSWCQHRTSCRAYSRYT